MAHLVLAEEEYTARFGPTPVSTPAGGWDPREPDELLKTHCCFCGVQCGIQLKVKDNKVIWATSACSARRLRSRGNSRRLSRFHWRRLRRKPGRRSAGGLGYFSCATQADACAN